MAEPQKTPLFEVHQEWGARLVDFAGWMMPVQYKSIIEEHHAVRCAVGVFDISHMGEFLISGEGADVWLNSMLTNDVHKLTASMGQYTLMLNEQGGVIDDLILYNLAPQQYFAVVNASKIDEDFAWLQKHLPAGIALENRSDELAALAVQGPKALELMTQAFPNQELPSRNQMLTFAWKGKQVRLARTGYTGEDGFEVFFHASEARTMWELLLNSGKPLGALPCGLGARDTLRLEACLPLNGNDLFPNVTPLEVGLGKFVALNKAEKFIGQNVLQTQKEQGVPRSLVAFVATEEGVAPPRAHYAVFQGEKKVGEVTSGTLSPTLKKGVGLALIETQYASVGTQLQLDIRGRRVSIQVQPKPLYKKSS